MAIGIKRLYKKIKKVLTGGEEVCVNVVVDN